MDITILIFNNIHNSSPKCMFMQALRFVFVPVFFYVHPFHRQL